MNSTLVSPVIGQRDINCDGLYSTESDYTSSTLIGNFTQYFAEIIRLYNWEL